MEVQVCELAPLHMGNEPPQFLHRDGDQNRGCGQAAADRLLLFALPEAVGVFVSSKRARKPARNAKASIESVM